MFEVEPTPDTVLRITFPASYDGLVRKWVVVSAGTKGYWEIPGVTVDGLPWTWENVSEHIDDAQRVEIAHWADADAEQQ